MPKRFHVRNCHSTYYQLILRDLFTENNSCVTVTRTPDNDKSILSSPHPEKMECFTSPNEDRFDTRSDRETSNIEMMNE
ncbi:hypothetical protein PPTG_22163 [Phytophthora nicotianae INRA-310]|uniref:Uncharacterized protein n=1 Tax=Phytophthora nicotianae (strain INRA-310) TaxID=761204 RepID=W2QNQ9_PHYN3|nr:hypothetical protein PPTG_22163 [Phytophthora nicotianae INRA-310]ETN14611.1 hypothetical protein PPTG_22163 [Phytophthora nicotianae INRA-310]